MSTFAIDVAAFCEKAKANGDAVLRKTLIGIGFEVVDRSPVGNPELWAVNTNARAMSKTGKIGGLKMQGKGYVGGRFRANWVISADEPSSETTEAVDPSGEGSKGRLSAFAVTSKLGKVYYIMNNLPYAIPLENGHSSQAPAGMVGLTVARYQTFISEAVASL